MSHVQASCIYHRREMMWRDCHLGPGTGMRAPHLAVGGGWRPRAQPCIPRGHGLASSLSVVFWLSAVVTYYVSGHCLSPWSVGGAM